MLEVTDLHAYYGKSHILQGVNLNIQEGEIVALLGRNGWGGRPPARRSWAKLSRMGPSSFAVGNRKRRRSKWPTLASAMCPKTAISFPA